MKKVLFVDLDGTLLDDKKQVAGKNREMIEKAMEAGHQVILNTGRPTVSARIVAKQLNLDRPGCYIVTYNGGEIYDTYREETLFRKTIPKAYVRRIFDEAHKAGLHCQSYDHQGILAERDCAMLQRYMKRTNVQARILPDVTAVMKEDPVKMIVMDMDDHQKLVAFQQELADWTRDKMDVVFSCPEYLEHIPAGVSKGTGLQKMCELLDIPVENTIAVGDEENDLPMLQAAGLGVVMKNASDSIKTWGDYVTEHDNNQAGVAEVIEKFLLLK